jgi:hypothetical protein
LSKKIERWEHFKENEEQIIAIQAVWRGALQRLRYKKRLDTLRSHDQLWSKLQARYKANKDRAKYLEKLQRWRDSQDAITKIQALWRAKQAEKSYKALCKLSFWKCIFDMLTRTDIGSMRDANMKVLQNFLFLLEDDKDLNGKS